MSWINSGKKKYPMGLNKEAKLKLDEETSRYFNQCVSLKPLLGAINMIKVEPVKKERSIQPRTNEEEVS